MSEPTAPTVGHTSTAHAVRHHFGWVVVCLLLGLVGGWFYANSSEATYTSTARVLVNPSAGNPFVPTPSSVRQDELTSLETEAQVMRSDEVLNQVVAAHPDWAVKQIQRGLSVLVPPNTQILEVSYTDKDKTRAQEVTEAVADTYLANRSARFDQQNGDKIKKVSDRIQVVLGDLDKNLKDSLDDSKTPAEKLFYGQVAETNRNELVSLRAQLTALEQSESPAGVVIAPASAPASPAGLTALIMPIGGVAAGVALGVLIAVLLERFRGRIRSEHDVELRGLPVVASIPARGPIARLRHRTPAVEAVDTTVRRVRATILDLAARPDVIAVAPTGSGAGDPGATEAIAHSFAKAGHSVVLVRADLDPAVGHSGLEEREGLSQVLLYERLNVLELLQPTVEPLLSVLPDGGFTDQTRELLVADRFRSVLAPLVDAGHLVVVQSAGLDSPEGEAAVGAADLTLAVVTEGRTRSAAVDKVVKLRRRTGAPLLAFVVMPRSFRRRATRLAEEHHDRETTTSRPDKKQQRTRAQR